MNREEVLNELYNLILDKATRQWERQCLLETKQHIENNQSLSEELSKLEALLRPLAIRYNLTPGVTVFYEKITDSKLFGRGIGKII